MEKQNQSSLSLLALLPEGKVENDVRIADKAVTGICTVYVKRTDNEKEFLLREIGVAPLDGNNLTDAVRIAVDQAYDAALIHIAGINQYTEPQQPQAPEKTNKPGAKPIQEPKPEPESPAPSPSGEEAAEPSDVADTPKTDEPDAAPDTGTGNQPPPVDLGSIFDTPEIAGANPAGQTNIPSLLGDGNSNEPAENGGIERIDFAGNLFPASDLLDSPDGGNNDGGDDDGGDPEYKNALDMDITIFGKLHDCNNWKAGKILSERPDVIVDFCHRNSEDYNGAKYTGPRTDQKEALFKLYPDAVRKVDKAA